MKASLFKWGCLFYVEGTARSVGYSLRVGPVKDWKRWSFDWIDGPWASLGPLVQFHVFREGAR